MTFVPENDLERALLSAASDNSGAAEFYRLLLDCELMVLGTVEGHETAREKIRLAPGAKLNLVPGEIAGRKFLPVFSSLTRMQAYVKKESKYLCVNGRALLETTRGVNVILNPGSDCGKELSPQEIGHLLTPGPLHGEPQMPIAQTEYPTPLVDALIDLFARRAEITAAWIIQVTSANAAKVRHPLVGVETGGDMVSLMQQIEAVAKKAAPGILFDVQRVDRTNPVGMADALLRVEPFYQRNRPSFDPSLH